MTAHESILSDGMHRRDERPIARWPVAAVVLLGIVSVIIGIFATSGAGEVEAQRDAAAEQAQSLGAQVVAACARGDVVQSPDGRDLCERAAEVRDEPVPDPVVLQGEPGRAPTAQEIQAAVDVYLAEHPPPAGRPPTTSEVAAAVAEYLIANPPQPGRPPTAAEISSAVSTYFANNPPPEGPQGEPGIAGEQGERGPRGEPGRAPTEEEIQDAVDAWLAENPPPPGPTCPPGSTLQPVEFASGERGLGCVTEQAPPPPTGSPPPTTATEDSGIGELFDGG